MHALHARNDELDIATLVVYAIGEKNKRESNLQFVRSKSPQKELTPKVDQKQVKKTIDTILKINHKFQYIEVGGIKNR